MSDTKLKALLHRMRRLSDGWEKQGLQMSRRRGAGYLVAAHDVQRELARFDREEQQLELPEVLDA